MKDTDTEEAKRRAEWLNEHRAPKDWLIVTESEISSARTEFSAIERERDKAREALEHIVEYWNRDENETSMSDALWHIIQTAVDVLHATKPDQLKEGAK